jgi:hypothetical protein
VPNLTEASPAAELTDGDLREGFALPIARARLLIERRQHIKTIESGDEAAVFTAQLGQATLVGPP